MTKPQPQTRRAVLRRAALAGSAAALAGCGGRRIGPDDSTPDSRRVPAGVRELANRWEFESVTVPETTASGDGPRPLTAALERSASDGSLLFLEPGRYRLDGEFAFAGFDRFGIVGRDATLVPPEGFDETLLSLGYGERSGAVLVEGLEVDFRATDTGGRPLVASAADRLVVRDVSVTGTQDTASDTVRVDVTNPDGRGVIERLQLPDGGAPGSSEDDSGVTGCEVGSDTRGDLAFVDCHIEGFPDNGLYADPPEGTVEVRGGYYANNGVSNVRINGASGSAVRGVHVRCDRAVDGIENMRGIRLRGGENPVVENCLIEFETVTSSDGAVTIHSELAAATVRNCRIRVDADDVPAVLVKSPDSGVAADGPIVLRSLRIEGEANGSAGVDLSERQNVTVEQACVHQTGRERDGIRASDSSGRIANSLIAVRGQPLAFEQSNMRTAGLALNRQPRAMSNVNHGSCRHGKRVTAGSDSGSN